MNNFNKAILSLIIILFSSQYSFSQVVINLEQENGVYKVPCKINGIPMTFILDTGASNVTISLNEAQFLFKQGLLNKSDIISSENYQIANGEIIEGTKINIKKIELENFLIENTVASVVHTQNAPLLLGMSAINKLGKISIENNKLIIHNSETTEKIINETQETIDWINSKFAENKNSWWGIYHIENIKTIENEPFLFISMRDICSVDGNLLIKVPIKKIKPISFIGPSGNDTYDLILQTKNNEEVIWYQNEDKSCGQIGNEMSITLNASIENEDIMNRLKIAFNYLMSLYGNDGKEKF